MRAKTHGFKGRAGGATGRAGRGGTMELLVNGAARQVDCRRTTPCCTSFATGWRCRARASAAARRLAGPAWCWSTRSRLELYRACRRHGRQGDRHGRGPARDRGAAAGGPRRAGRAMRLCLSGILVSAAALLRRNHSPDRAEVAAALDGNLCRCGAHNRIIRAVRALPTACARPHDPQQPSPEPRRQPAPRSMGAVGGRDGRDRHRQGGARPGHPSRRSARSPPRNWTSRPNASRWCPGSPAVARRGRDGRQPLRRDVWGRHPDGLRGSPPVAIGRAASSAAGPKRSGSRTATSCAEAGHGAELLVARR